MRHVLLMLAVTLALMVACTRQAGSPPVADVAPAPSAPAPVTTAAPAAPSTPVVEPPKPVLPNGLDVDLNADGVPERVAGPLGQWSDQPVVVYDQTGNQLFTSKPDHIQRALVQVVTIPGQDRPALLYQFEPKVLDRNTTLVWFAPNGDFRPTWDWQPSVPEVAAETFEIESDGTIVVTGTLRDPLRHRFERRYEIVIENRDDFQRFSARVTLKSERLSATSEYPNTAEGVLEAAMVAKAYRLKDELPRYFSDPAVAAAFAADERPRRPGYDLWSLKVGKVTLPAKSDEMVKVDPQPLDPKGGTTGFNLQIGRYEGSQNYYGTATLFPGSDGRWTIQALTVDGDIFIY